MHPDLHLVAEQRMHDLHEEATLRRRSAALTRKRRIRAAVGHALVRAGERLAPTQTATRRTAVTL
jgi:hypothetical protein